MVNPNKHKNNLNENDITLILDFLDNKYDTCKNKKDKKEINQMRMIILLAAKKLNTKDLITLPTFIVKDSKDQILQNYVDEHLKHNFCKTKGLLLTKHNNKQYSQKDIELLLKKIKVPNLNKKITIEKLNITKNKYNKISFNKQNIRKTVEKLDKIPEKMKNSDADYEKSSTKNINDDSLKNLNNKINKIDKKLDLSKKEIEKYYKEIERIDIKNIVDDINLLKSNVNKLKDNFEKLDEYVTYNVYENDINDINNKIDVIVDYVNKMNNIQNSNIKRINKIEKENKNIKNKLNTVDEIKKDFNNIKKYSNISSTRKSSDTNVNINPCINNKRYDSYELLSNWIKNNITITKNAHDNVNSEEIINKVSKLFSEKNLEVKEEDLKNNIKTLLLSYYKQRGMNIQSRDISTNINDNDIFSFMKFTNSLKQDIERNNIFKNIMKEWIEINTVKTDNENDKISTEDIVEYLKPLFEKEGWIISTEIYKEAPKLGKKKICDDRTFSEIAGKAMYAVYESVKENKVVEKNRMHYPGIKIKNIESEKINNMIRDEISYPSENDDDFLCKWFNDNLSYSNNLNDKLNLDEILLKFNQYLKENNVEISDDSINILFNHSLSIFCEENTNEKSIYNNNLIGFTWKHNPIRTWINNYLTITNYSNDEISYKQICNLITLYLSNRNTTRINNELYNKMPDNLKDNFISETEFNNNINYELDKYSKFKIIKDDDIYYTNIKYLNLNEITTDTIKKWVNNNIKIIDNKNHIISQKEVIEKFKEDMIENSFKNIKKIDLEKEIFKNITNYYLNNKKEDIQTLSDESNVYYRFIELKG